MEYRRETISGVVCDLWKQGEGGPVILWGFYAFRPEDLQHMEEVIGAEMHSAHWMIIAYHVNDWNGEFSPWQNDQAFHGETFAGRGPETLNRLRYLLSVLGETVENWYRPDGNVYLTGYSLAGLFSLWAAYELQADVDGIGGTGLALAGVACCSGSLWYPDWLAYAENYISQCRGRIYLSLGGKEPNSKDPLIATIGDCTRKMDHLLAQAPYVSAHTFEWNPGGHFADSAKRVVKGINWLLA